MAEDMDVAQAADTPRGLAHRQSNLNAHRRLLPQAESSMQRLRLKADGRIVELRDGREFPLAPATTYVAPITPLAAPVTTYVAPTEMARSPAVRDLRRRTRLTQLEFAARLGVPVETIRNWEQGKRMPRGPARALLAVIAHAPETVFAALAADPSPV
jgi:putative transcriptional regulator